MPDLEWQRSSFSNGSGSGECVEVTTAAEATTNCVELAAGCHAATWLRESDEPELALITRPARLTALLGAIKAGRIDL
jgi:hypothetical protein